MKDKSTNHRAAEAYVEKLHWRVFPIRPKDKRPLSAHGFHDATDDLEQIDRWWTGTPDAGVGLATGLPSGLVVLDIDPRNGGDKTLAALVAQFGELPVTPIAETGGGGLHYLFRHPGGTLIPCSKPWLGIDVKSDGGYIVAPFSTHPSGARYTWKSGLDPLKVPLAEIPSWLKETLLEKKAAALERAKNFLEPGDGRYKEGSRNDALTSLAGTMQRRGMSFEAILQALLAENMVRCSPPLEEGEVYAVAKSVSRYSPEDPVEATVSPSDTSSRRITMVDLSVAAVEDPPKIDWIIPNMLAHGDCALLVGPPGAGKSWITMELGVAGAAGRPLFGVFDPHPVKVLIVDEENPPGEQHRRLRALVRAWEVKPDELLGRLNLCTPCQGFSFRDTVYERALHRMVEEIQPDLIVLDSVTAVSSIVNENDAVQVRRFFHDHLYPLRSICESTILCIHHTTKAVYQYEAQVEESGMARGSIDYIAAADSALLLRPVVRGGLPLRLAPIKTRRGRIPDPLVLEIVDGAEGGARPMARQRPNIPKAENTKAQRARQIVLQLLADRPGCPSPSKDLTEWVQVVDQALTAADVRYVLKTLVDERKIESDGGYPGNYWLPAPLDMAPGA